MFGNNLNYSQLPNSFTSQIFTTGIAKKINSNQLPAVTPSTEPLATSKAKKEYKKLRLYSGAFWLQRGTQLQIY